MKFSRFEQLVLVIGAIAIIGSFASAIPSGTTPEAVEVIAQLLLMGVLFAAVRYGRKGGLVAAVAAMVIYVVMRLQDLSTGPITVETAVMVGSRLLAFGILGIVGGELCARLRYTLTRLEDGSPIDEASRVFNQRFAARELTQALGRFRRYSEPFSVIVIALSDSIFAGARPARVRNLVRGVADRLRGDVRMVDEVARLDDGRFVVILPHTPLSGAEVVKERLAALSIQALGAGESTVKATVLAVPEHESQISDLLAELAPEQAAPQIASE